MERVSDRHEDDLNGQLQPFAQTNAIRITVDVPSETAHLASVQHTTWMLINLLARMEGIIDSIGLLCPVDVPLAGRVVPLVSGEVDFRTAVLQGASEIDIIPVVPEARYDHILVVGPGDAVPGSLRVYGEAWWGGISRQEIGGTDESSLPFGAYIAACLAAAEVFKSARMSPDAYEPVNSAFYSAWFHQNGSEPPKGGPDRLENITLDVALAGVGAVGSAWIHALWSCLGVTGQALLADNDLMGVDLTNLNRYSLFGRNSVGQLKASEAARIAGDADIKWLPYDNSFEELSQIPSRVISAVDRNRARAAIQQRYPGRILSASTFDLRAEVVRCGPPGEGACLRCFNPPEELVSDDALRVKLREQSSEQLTHLSGQVGLTVEEASAWIQQGTCGLTGERLLPFIRQSEEQPRRFAVGFVSVMAGTLLAAETVKDVLRSVNVPLTDTISRAVFQFWSPTARTNRASFYRRDEACPLCNPATEAVKIWKKRFQALNQQT